jgi:hypothetical protein
MAPFSFKAELSYSRGMKKEFIRYDPGPWVPGADHRLVSIIDRHAGLVGQTCRFAPIKKASLSADVAIEAPHEPNLFPRTQPAPGVPHFLSVPIGVHPWFKKPVRFQAI